MGVVPDLDMAKIRKYCESKNPPQFRSEMRLMGGNFAGS